MDTLRHEYERSVRALAADVERMRREGASVEMIARTVHVDRRALAQHYKALTPEPLRTAIYDRTLAVYGNTSGPTIEYLRAESKTLPAPSGRIPRSQLALLIDVRKEIAGKMAALRCRQV